MKKISRLLSILIMAMMIATPFMSFATEEESFSAQNNESNISMDESVSTEDEDTEIIKESVPLIVDENTDGAATDPDETLQNQDTKTGTDNLQTENEEPASEETEGEITNETTDVTIVSSAEELAAKSNAADNDAFFTIDVNEKTVDTDLATDEITETVDSILSSKKSTSKKQDAVIDSLEESGYYTAEEGSGSKIDVTLLFAAQRLRLVADKQDELEAYGANTAVYYKNYYLLTYDSIEETKLAYEALQNDYGSSSVVIDRPVKVDSSVYGWGTPYMGMLSEKANTKAVNGEEVVVAVCDTGIYKSHMVFSGRSFINDYNVLANNEKYGGLYTDPYNASDDQGHGTAVAGIIAESTPTKTVKIMPIKVLDSNGEGYTEDVITGIEYAAQNGADIINLSLGSSFTNCTDEDLAEFQVYDNQLSSYESLIVCASGNKNSNMDPSDVFEFPGELSSTVCVGAITSEGIRCVFSNYGSAVDISAPGYQIVVPTLGGTNYYRRSSGTSFASPYIAAAAALIKAENGSFNKAQIRNKLDELAVDLGPEGKDDFFGIGCPTFPAGNEVVAGGAINRDGTTIYFTGESDSYITYTGTAREPQIKIMYYYYELKPGIDYSVAFKDNVNAGKATAVITGKGNYEGSFDLPYTIHPRSIVPNISLSGTQFAYTGKSITPEVTVRDGSKVLTNGKDYTVSYANNVNAGTANVRVTCKGNYSGSAIVTFTINAAQGSSSVDPASSGGTSSGGSAVDSPATDNVSAPAIVPAGTGLKKLSKARKAITVNWKKQAAKTLGKRVAGYQVQVALDPDFTQVVKEVNVKGFEKTSKKIGKLAKKTSYYVRVRTYMNYGGTVYYSDWSSVKSAKTK